MNHLGGAVAIAGKSTSSKMVHMSSPPPREIRMSVSFLVKKSLTSAAQASGVLLMPTPSCTKALGPVTQR
jgi:hypothetical protein